MKTALQIEANIVSNLIQLANERGLPTTFTATDIAEILSSPDIDEAAKFNTLRRVKGALHEVLYAPPSRG